MFLGKTLQCFSKAVGPDGLQRSFPTSNILWYCDSVNDISNASRTLCPALGTLVQGRPHKLNWVHWKATKMAEGIGLVQPGEEKTLCGPDSILGPLLVSGGYRVDEARVFIVVPDGRMRENDERLKHDNFRLHMKKNFLTIEDCQTLEYFFHRICEIPILESLEKCKPVSLTSVPRKAMEQISLKTMPRSMKKNEIRNG
ncbi:hypothetical protein QYF61_015799 [Mycteria americana]|uniref:Uncharacterized protein n=1 Tax=Mycteria americana TaxID=33587 RepID=A0AAN7NAP4_MYCAM|nr:hypothetical protein QYF61_015799 [Mycteria americana]